MNLNFILNVALGLIFIYLILSLLAAEIQELFATLLQWRARHLKQSIELLLAGGTGNTTTQQDIEKSRTLANQLYTNPLIENMNQQAKGWLEELPREVTWKIGYLYRLNRRKLTKSQELETVFGDNKHSGPSYISSETFATTLMENLKISTLAKKFSESKLDELNKNLIESINYCLLNRLGTNIEGMSKDNLLIRDEEKIDKLGRPINDLVRLVVDLEKQLNTILNDFQDNKATLSTTFELIHDRFNKYNYFTKIRLQFLGEPVVQNFNDHMQRLKSEHLGGEKDWELRLRGIKPSLIQIVDTINANTEIYQQIRGRTVDDLPKSLKESLSALAYRAQSRVEIVETDINQLRKEIELWFDRSMARASGVYKRNAKGVAILIGMMIAGVANADTFEMASKLSEDSVLRAAVTQYAEQAVSTCATAQEQPATADCLREQIAPAVRNISLPIGWKSLQMQDSIKDNSSTFIDALLTNSWVALKKIVGLFLTGLAVSMGAPFWFDLLSKVINVRNTGPKPPANTTQLPANARNAST